VTPGVIDPEALFPADVARYVAYFKSAKPITPGGEVLTPGEPEHRTRQQRLTNGIPLPDEIWAAIVAAAREVGVDERHIQQTSAGRAPSRCGLIILRRAPWLASALFENLKCYDQPTSDNAQGT